MAKTFHKILKGYTAQARWYAANMAGDEWKQVGWSRLGNGDVKPVFEMTNGIHVVVLNGQTHLHAVVSEVPAGCVFETEEAAFAAQSGW